MERMMNIVRFEQEGVVRFGCLENGQVVPCQGDPFVGLEHSGQATSLESVRLLSPIDPPNVICLGVNYRKHAEENNVEIPEQPLFFIKPTTSVCGPYDNIIIPKHFPDQLDYEIELALVIGKKAKNVAESQALDYVLGYTVANDVSNRGAQFSDGQWARGKGYDTFLPMGPVLSTNLDAGGLDLSCRVNGKVVQFSSTADMIFSLPHIVSYLSECMTLLPGTVILTGTPEGVGFTQNPPLFLKAGDVVTCEIEGIGTIRNKVIQGHV